MSAQLNRLAPSLREVGVHVERPTSSHKGGRKWMVYFRKPGDAGDGDATAGDGDENNAVPPENPIGKPNAGAGDAGDAGDGDSRGSLTTRPGGDNGAWDGEV